MRLLNFKVKNYIIRDVATLSKEAKTRSVAKMIADYAVGSVIIVDECEKPIGIITARDLVKKVIAYRTDNPLAESAEEIMSYPVICVSQESTMRNAASLMFHHNIKRLPVVGITGKLVGLITIAELIDTFDQVLDDDSISEYIDEVVKVLEALKCSREISGKSSEVLKDKRLATDKKNTFFESEKSTKIDVKEKESFR
ncbi:MAG: cyclic nucleotide-binding/CBS domain-containing protein [Candidatus Hodarchaeota archaeon]